MQHTKHASNENEMLISYDDLEHFLKKEQRTLIVCSEWDNSLYHVYELMKVFVKNNAATNVLSLDVIRGANHEFQNLAHQQSLIA